MARTIIRDSGDTVGDSSFSQGALIGILLALVVVVVAVLAALGVFSSDNNNDSPGVVNNNNTGQTSAPQDTSAPETPAPAAS